MTINFRGPENGQGNIEEINLITTFPSLYEGIIYCNGKKKRRASQDKMEMCEAQHSSKPSKISSNELAEFN